MSQELIQYQNCGDHTICLYDRGEETKHRYFIGFLKENKLKYKYEIKTEEQQEINNAKKYFTNIVINCSYKHYL
jgi:hypothetical protein